MRGAVDDAGQSSPAQEGRARKRPRSVAPRLHVAGSATCPFHGAAERLIHRVQENISTALPDVEVETLPDMAAFKAWAREQGLPPTVTSPVCSTDGQALGGFAELHAWLADRAAAATQPEGEDEAADIVLLSLRKHLRGRWLLDLRLALMFAGGRTRVLCIDADGGADCLWGEGGQLGLTLSPSAPPLPWRVLVNCVSDAAPAHVQQQLVSAMRAAEAAGALVLNGPSAHAACAAKVAQHALLRAAGCPSPRTLAVSAASGAMLAKAADEHGLQYPLLLKPNAGGFGNGIVSFASPDDLQAAEAGSEQLQGAFSGGGLALLQEQLTSADGRVGRIWVLDGEVLCAVRAPLMQVGGSGKTSASGCMADASAAAAAVAWDPEPAIRAEVARLARMAGATWGSVEMISPSDASDAEARWVYFDLNLSCVSTLPDPASVADPDKVWRPGFQPYDEMARVILKRLASLPRPEARA